MTFDMFQEYIEEHILEGWKSDVELDVAMVTKNNGVQLRGLYIKSKEMNVSPAIYLDEYYSYYLKGESLEEIICRIREEYEWKISRVADYHFKLEKFEYVKDRIIYRLVNYKKNEEILEDCPYLKLYDLALTFRWVAHSDDRDFYSTCNESGDGSVGDFYERAFVSGKREYTETISGTDGGYG